MQHVFIVGSKSLGAYGGFETFVFKLTEYHQYNDKIKYHVACKANGDGSMDEMAMSGVTCINNLEFVFHNAHCFKIPVPNIGPAVAIYYDIAAMEYCCKYIEKNHISSPIIYILACRIGPFIGYFYKKIHKLGGKVFLNPDGHEWLRSKWSLPIRKYWKLSEKMMVKHCDLVICDSVNIEKYIHAYYDRKEKGGVNPNTIYIAYGAETRNGSLTNETSKYQEWMNCKDLKPHEYYLVVGRFVPENNYETIIREFMNSKSLCDLVVITNVNNKFLDKLEERLHYKNDSRIKFVGTVYDPKLLKKIRENAYGYIHGHEVGGTNPSLLEALGSTDLNLLFDVSFNHEVAEENALYWTKKEGDLAELIDQLDQMDVNEIKELGVKARKRVNESYSWQFIVNEYEKVFLQHGGN